MAISANTIKTIDMNKFLSMTPEQQDETIKNASLIESQLWLLNLKSAIQNHNVGALFLLPREFNEIYLRNINQMPMN